MPAKPSFRILLLALSLLGATACVNVKAPPRTALDASHSADLNRQLESLIRSGESATNLSAFAQVTLRAGGHKELFDAALLARAPNQVLIQILDELGQERARFVADGTWVLFYDAQKNRYTRLPQTEESLRKTLRLPVSVEALLARLFMRVPSGPVLQWTSDEGSALPLYLAQRQSDRVGLSPEQSRLLSYEAFTSAGKLEYRVDYRMPEMLWSFKHPAAQLSLSFQSFDTEKPVPTERFDTRPPQDAVPE